MQLKQSLLKYTIHSISFILFVASIVGGFLLLYIVNTTFLIKEVRVNAVGANNVAELDGLKGLQGINTLFTTTEELEKLILTSNPQLRTVVVSKTTPGVVDVDVELRQSILQLKTQDGFFLLCEDAIVIEKSREARAGLPVLTLYQNIPYSSTQAGTKLGYSDIVSSIRLLTELTQLGFRVKDIAIDGSYVIRLVLDNDKTILVSTQKELEQTVYELGTIVRETARRDIEFSSIDLRFDKPVYVPQ